jgi:hypothetical protein
LSSYKVTLVPGGVSGKDVGVGINMVKVPSLEAAASGSSNVVATSTSLEVTIIHPSGMVGASIQINGPGGFDQTIAETTLFDPIIAGDYTIVAAAVSGHNVRVFSSPATVPDPGKTCAFVIYDVQGDGGGGGDCTSTCPLDGLRWIPLGTPPSIDISFPNDIENIRDSEFTESYPLGERPNGTNEIIAIEGQVYTLYGRFFGAICPGDVVSWFGGSGGQIPDVENNSATSIYTDTRSFGRTVWMNILVQRAANVLLPSIILLGYVLPRCSIWHKVGATYDNVCGPGTPTELSSIVYVKVDYT